MGQMSQWARPSETQMQGHATAVAENRNPSPLAGLELFFLHCRFADDAPLHAEIHFPCADVSFDHDDVARLDFSLKQFERQRVLDELLDRALQRTRAVGTV